jgi:hypothetical protein
MAGRQEVGCEGRQQRRTQRPLDGRWMDFGLHHDYDLINDLVIRPTHQLCRA